MVKFNVITESQPKEDPFGMVKVGVLVDDEYVFPSIQIKFSQAVRTSVAVTKELTKRFNVAIESQPETAIKFAD
jgi:hypothetical protein